MATRQNFWKQILNRLRSEFGVGYYTKTEYRGYNGSVKSESNFLNGMPHGISREWETTSFGEKLRKEQKYSRGKLLEEKQWNPINDKLKSVTNYAVLNGEKVENYKSFYYDGQAEMEINFKNGKEDGIYREWWPNGNLRVEKSFKNGVPHGMHREWFERGQLRVEGMMGEGKREGVLNEWDESGSLRKEERYKNGKKEGMHRAWNEHGGPVYEVEYHNDMWHGVRREWGREGLGVIYENYGVHGKHEGPSRTYDLLSGQILSEVNYNNQQQMDGPCRQWDVRGNLKSETYYINGVQVKEDPRIVKKNESVGLPYQARLSKREAQKAGGRLHLGL